MMVTKQTAFPAAKAVERERYRNRHIHAHHAHLHAINERTRHRTIGGVNTRAVAVFMIIDQFQCRGEIRFAHHAQHRAENFFFVNRHLRRDVVKQRTAQEIPRLIHNRMRTTIDHQRRALFLALLDVTRDFRFMRRCDQRPHVFTGVFVIRADAIANI